MIDHAGDGAAPVSDIRGKLAPQRLDSRELVAWATSPCQRARVIGAARLTPRVIHEQIYRGSPPPPMSSFTEYAGVSFENDLIKNDAKVLRRILSDAGYDELATAPIASVQPPGRDWSDYVGTSADILLSRMKGEHTAPQILLQTALEIPDRCMVRPDIVCSWKQRGWRVGEIKSYLDRDGLTDGYKISKTILQAAVGVWALRHLAERHGLDPGLISDQVDIALRRNGRDIGRLHVVHAISEISAIDHAIASVEDDLAEARRLGISRLDRPDQVEMIPASYGHHCVDVCELEGICRSRRLQQQPVQLLGALGRRITDGDVPADRLKQLWAGDQPQNDIERAAVKSLRAGL